MTTFLMVALTIVIYATMGSLGLFRFSRRLDTLETLALAASCFIGAWCTAKLTQHIFMHLFGRNQTLMLLAAYPVSALGVVASILLFKNIKRV